MRYWQTSSVGTAQLSKLPAVIAHLGTAGFQRALLQELHELIPAASYALYRTGAQCQPQLFLSDSLGTPNHTQACWQAYSQGLHLDDHTLPPSQHLVDGTWLSHLTAQEVPARHRQTIYEAHALSERLSLHKPLATGGVLALNYYRHSHQTAFTDRHLANFESLALSLLALVEKHLQLIAPPTAGAPLAAHAALAVPPPSTATRWAAQLQAHCPALTAREQQVCVRLLQGMTYEGIAADLGVSATTAKTYRNRAFHRLGIHFRNQLFALLHDAPVH